MSGAEISIQDLIANMSFGWLGGILLLYQKIYLRIMKLAYCPDEKKPKPGSDTQT
ncbi:hypothetical protein IQ230_01040 [Gloeocapsopsis crepidinum LEGE 06123]|uniref:Uncharacterized protein n=1 Tax=Gloeocapsopsis crepidinum LEGE 06123 TaxID=588587 RepID=A0ABR9UL02_9CHRO|nr:hypothetical protein [Gloeocapsopsis crepidinum LEGE 06123]